MNIAPLAEELADLTHALRRVTVEVRTRGPGAGSGIVWTANGLIVTNAHVARGDDATIVLHDGRAFDGIVVARDVRRDLAAITTIAAPSLEPARIGRPTDLRTGDLVVALGHPLGVVGAAALGVIHVVDVGRGAPRWIRADVRLAPGNSGGPLADVHGRVVGVNTLIANGLGVAVPVTTVRRFLSDARLATSRPGTRAA